MKSRIFIFFVFEKKKKKRLRSSDEIKKFKKKSFLLNVMLPNKYLEAIPKNDDNLHHPHLTFSKNKLFCGV